VKILLIGIGGLLGANARYWLGLWITTKFAAQSAFPWGTFVINVTGSFLLGLFSTISRRYGWHETGHLLVAVGFFGAYTTFSTFEYDNLQLLLDGSTTLALRNMAGSLIVGLLAVWLGVTIGRWLSPS
jgi:fluoride exporter